MDIENRHSSSHAWLYTAQHTICCEYKDSIQRLPGLISKPGARFFLYVGKEHYLWRTGHDRWPLARAMHEINCCSLPGSNPHLLWLRVFLIYAPRCCDWTLVPSLGFVVAEVSHSPALGFRTSSCKSVSLHVSSFREVLTSGCFSLSFPSPRKIHGEHARLTFQRQVLISDIAKGFQCL